MKKPQTKSELFVCKVLKNSLSLQNRTNWLACIIKNHSYISKLELKNILELKIVILNRKWNLKILTNT